MTTQKPQVTIIIPVYNRGDVVGRTLLSIEKQTYRPLKVVLVDNNSTDHTLAELNHWKDANQCEEFQIIVAQEKTPGAPAARNAGLALSDTEWTLFFDSDDIMCPGHVESALKCAKENPSAQIVGWDRLIHFHDGSTAKKRFATSNPVYNNLFHSILATQGYMAKTSLFREAGGWDNIVVMGDDIELGNRLLLLKPKMTAARGLCVNIFESVDSISVHSNKMSCLLPALEKIRATLPENHRHWVDLQILIKCASWAKSDPESAEIARQVIARAPRKRRWLWRLLYRYQYVGGRGVARIYALLAGALA